MSVVGRRTPSSQQASKPRRYQQNTNKSSSQALHAAESLKAYMAAIDAVIDIKHTQASSIIVRSKPPASAKPAAHMLVPA
jgi:hypothetical protein